MDRKEFIELIRISFAWLEQLGYKFEHIETSITYLKESEDFKTAIGFNWGEYNNILIFGISALKGFNRIENIISQLSGNDRDFTIKKRWISLTK